MAAVDQPTASCLKEAAMNEERAATDSAATTRRALLTGAGAVGASVVLGGCGNGTGGTGEPGPRTSGGPGATGGTGSGAMLGKASDIPVGGGKIFTASSVVVTQPNRGTFKGFSAICTHQGCPVASVDGGVINCTCHGSRFSIEDGSVRTGPATRSLPPKDVKVSGDNITLG
jgi:nitrite reductase/ring-hydroxylating ferredoxin subunit